MAKVAPEYAGPLEAGIGHPVTASQAATVLIDQPVREQSMIAHTSLAVSDYPKSKDFYCKALAPLGYSNNMEYGQAAGFNDGKNTAASAPIMLATLRRACEGGFSGNNCQRDVLDKVNSHV